MPLYIQSFCHPDYSQTITWPAVDVKDKVFQDTQTSRSLAEDCFARNYLDGKPFTSYGMAARFVYIPFDYKPGVSSINSAFIAAQTLKPFIDSDAYYNDLFSSTYANILNPSSEKYKIRAFELSIVIINKFYCNFRNVFYDQYGIEHYVTMRDDSIYINFSFAKLVSVEVTIGTSIQIIDFIIKSEKTYDYLEDFSSEIFYSAGSYYLDAAFTQLANLKVREEFFPFLLINDDSQGIKGKVASDFTSLGEDLNPNEYVNITQVNPPVINQNIITCSVNSPGYADVVYGGKPYPYEDTQICGNSPVVNGNPIAVIRRDGQFNLDLYKSFAALTSETVSIYANNFRYIKYVTLVSNSTAYTAFKDNGSIATSTVKFSNEILNLNNYYSIEEDSDGYISGITFRFVVCKSSETESGALFYNLTIPVNVYIPEIISASYNADGSKLILVSNYATTIKYYLGEDSENLQTISVTDSANGLTQRTLIDINASSKNIAANAYSFFFDFNGGARAPYKSMDFNQSINFEFIITSLDLEIKSGSPLVTRTFYDSGGTAITNLINTPCYTTSFGNYTMYIDYVSAYNIYFYFDFTLDAGSESLYFKIGEGSDSNKLTSLYPVSIAKDKLFERLDSNGNIKLILLLNNKTPFEIPFQFLNFSTNAPQVTSVSSPVVAGASEMSVSFNFNYRYADLISYSILDQDNSVVYGPVTLLRKNYTELFNLFYSGSTISENIKTDKFNIQPTVISLKVKVTAGNLNSSFNLAEVSLQSSSTSLPQQLNQQTPAEVKFYSDQAMGPGTEITYISRGVTYYAFLQLKDVDGADILPANYGSYISLNPSPKFEAVESQDANLDLTGVSVTKINDYLYSFKISASSPFNDSAFVLDITYSPIVGIPIRENRVGSITNS